MRKKILLSASLFHAFDDAASVIVPMAFPILYSQQFLILKYSHIGILSNLELLTTFIFQIVIAHFSDRFEYKSMLFLSYTGICLFLVLTTFPTNFASFLFLYVILRVFTSFYHPLGIAWVSKTQPSQGIDFAMGIQSGSGNLGVFLAFISAGFLAQKYNWKLPFLVWSALGIFLGTASVLAVRKVSSKRRENLKLDLSSWLQTLSKMRHSILGLIFGGACWSTTVYFAPSLLHHKFHVPMGQTGAFLASWIGLGTVISYFFGALARRFGRSKICLTAFSGSALSLCLLGMASVKELAVVGLFLFGTFLFLVYPALQAFVGGQVAEKNQTQAFGLVANIQLIAGATMVLISGFVSDRFGISSPFLILAALGLLVTLSYGTRLFKLSG